MSDGESRRLPRAVDFPIVFVGGRLDGLVELECRHPPRLFSGPTPAYVLERELDGFLWARSVDLVDLREADRRLRRILAHATAAWVQDEPYRRYPTRPHRNQEDD